MPELMADVICRILGFILQDLIFFMQTVQKKSRRKNPQQGCTRMVISG
jgi:hypothetical protein